MSNENQQHHADPSPLPVQTPVTVDAAALGARGASRRRFARAGAGATGVLLTLASHPGMACSINVGPSGYQSAVVAARNGMKVSHAPTTTSSGRPPSHWCGSSSWPCATTVKFGHVFSCTRSNYNVANCTLKSLCAGTTSVSGDKAKIAALLSAAYLNVSSGLSPFLTVANLQAIWSEYQSKSTYTPMAGATPWNAVMIADYLNRTMD